MKTIADLNEESKTVQSLLSLHRSPDYFILSEILTEEHSKALFSALSSGLKGMETFHSTSVEQALRRWVIHHRIPLVCLKDLNLIVLMKKLEKIRLIRRVQGIYEVREDDPLKPVKIFSYDERSDELALIMSLEDSETFRRIADFFCISPSEVFKIYEEVKRGIKNEGMKIEEIKETVEFFDRLYRKIILSRWLHEPLKNLQAL